ncbi:MAG: DUF262 domain-containing protein [Eubacterium sp.]|nr:DUF262 domain-containing protein [Eubacterium sp.]
MGEQEIIVNEIRVGSKPITLGQLIEQVGEFVVPEYQRPYEWNHDQIDKMLENLSCDDSGDKNDKEELIFFGSLQINENGGKSEIIDGQQRITSFLLLIAAFNELEFLGVDEERYLRIGNICIKYNNNVKENKFKDNYDYIKNRINELELDLERIKKNTVFILISTKGKASLETMLKIFSSMNMEGLPLQSEDVFKVKYADMFENSSEVLNNVNKKYEEIYAYNDTSDISELSEYDLIDTFKFWIIAHSKSDSLRSAKILKQNAITFFVQNYDVIIKEEESINIDVFCKIADTMLETQKIIDQHGEEIFKSGEEIWFSRELIGEAKYWNLKNIVFFLVHKISLEKGSPKKEEIKVALEIAEVIWQYCSVFRAGASKVLTEVYNKILEFILKKNISIDWKKIIEEFNESAKNSLNGENVSYFNKFIEMLNGDCFNGNIPHLMTELSYFEDCVCNEKNECTVNDIKRIIFYRKYNSSYKGKQRNLDIEHIISRYFEKEIGIEINSIGNLMYLERNINRNIGSRLGRKEKNSFQVNDDISELKIPKDSNESSYRKSELKCAERICDLYEEKGRTWTKDDCIARKENKIKYIKELYKIKIL